MTDRTDRAALEQQVVERAGRDPQFRQDLIGDPRGVMERELGVTIPAGIELAVLEETPSAVYLVLPSAATRIGDELSDAQLESVAGGWTMDTQECGSCDAGCRSALHLK